MEEEKLKRSPSTGPKAEKKEEVRHEPLSLPQEANYARKTDDVGASLLAHPGAGCRRLCRLSLRCLRSQCLRLRLTLR
eukprot:1383612-Rhodomonas_salina.4